jgi:2,4'-dihydroxyacetophenone dioxygenase
VKYQLPQPAGVLRELVVPAALALDVDESCWIPQAEGVWFRPLLFGVGAGLYVNLLRVRAAGVLSRHRHNGPVHALTLRGQWRYLEHDWTAGEGHYVFEPPGEVHTLVVPDHVPEMIAWFCVSGGYTYVDPYGQATGYEDVYTKLERAQRHYRDTGRDPGELQRLVR